jgi:hypothetical protein
MSITNRHAVSKFVSGESKPLNGQRLSKVGYKSTKNNPAKFPSVCASVPLIPETEIVGAIDSLIPHIRTMLESAQDGIFRNLYETSDGARTELGDNEITVSQCVAFLEAESTGGRLTKEFLDAWFVANVQDNLTVVIAEKLGFEDLTPNQMDTVQKHLNSYKGLIGSLSGGATILSAVQIQGVRRAIEVSSVDDSVSQKLIARLDKMTEKDSFENIL